MSFSTWRQFQFYEAERIEDPLSDSKHPLFSDHSLSAIAPLEITSDPDEPDSKIYNDSNLLVISYNLNCVKLVSLSNSKILYDFQAYNESDDYRITHIHTIKNLPSVFLTVAEEPGKPALLKVWKFGDHLRNPDSFLSLLEVKDKENSNHFPISAIVTSYNLSCIAIGYTNGTVVLIRGDILRDRGYKQRIIYSDEKNEPITSLQMDDEANTLFVSTALKIFTLPTDGRNNRHISLMLNSDEGILLNCSVDLGKKSCACLSQQSLDIYNVRGEKKSLALDTDNKTRLFYVDDTHYLIVTAINSSTYTSKNFADVTNYRIVIIDTENRLVSMSTVVTTSIVEVFKFTDNKVKSIMVVLGDGKLLKISEKTLNEQLSTVLQRDLYSIALKIAEQHKKSLKPNQISEIRKLYGDYLYKKNEKTAAMDQYVECLDIIHETSEIISKYSIAQGGSSDSIHNLSRFLWALLKGGCSHKDHITLLIITLIKLKDQENINFFIDHYSRFGKFVEQVDDHAYTAQEDEEYFYSDLELFDLRKILTLLIEADFTEEAYKTCRKFSKDPCNTVDILLRVLKDPVRALFYIKTLPIDDTLRVLMAYSKKLLDLLPNDTNALLINVFTGVYKPDDFPASHNSNPKHDSETLSDNFNSIVFHTYRSFFQYKSQIFANTSDDESASSEPTYHPPRPSLIFSSFINKPFEFVVFLEACLESYDKFKGFENDKQDILTTLYEKYLSLGEDDQDVDRRVIWKANASKIYQKVENSESFEPDSSLMLLISDLHNFTIDKEEIDSGEIIFNFRLLTLKNSHQSVIPYLEKHGGNEPSLFLIALKYCISSKSVLEAVGGAEVLKNQILKPVIEGGILDILDIIQLLSTNNVATFDIIKDILINHVKEETESIDTNKKLLDSYKEELEKVDDELKASLSEEAPVEIKLDRETCQICQTALELPVIFFKCSHSYHQRCLSEEDYELSEHNKKSYKCPRCIVELETANKLATQQAEFSQKQNKEFEFALSKNNAILDETLDGFKPIDNRFNTVLEFVSKGALESSHVSIT